MVMKSDKRDWRVDIWVDWGSCLEMSVERRTIVRERVGSGWRVERRGKRELKGTLDWSFSRIWGFEVERRMSELRREICCASSVDLDSRSVSWGIAC